MEDPLVDQANILATMIGQDMESGRFDTARLYRVFDGVYRRQLSAKIYEFDKTFVDMNIYITDKSGIVIFDAQNRANIGKDYIQWRDVRLTLSGLYGARTTRADPDDLKSSVLYVGAPIYVRGDIAGVLTIAKPTTNINNFIANFKPEFSKVVAISMFAAIILSLLASWWITLPLKRLTRYANDIGGGKNVKIPKLNATEIGEMGKAFEKMKTTLEGKKYVEQYIQTLTHEVKSPVSAIVAAAELLEEKMPPEQQAKFLANIRNEAGRINDIVERLLALSALENLKILPAGENIPLKPLISGVVESKQPLLRRKQIPVDCDISSDISISGDRFLLHEALSNLLQNAIDFSPKNEKIAITCRNENKCIKIMIEDRGPGIPDYALDKVFEKFYSLQRPDAGKKSTGLGLNFVREVATLHHGEIVLENRESGGARAILTLPA
ncbi:MAG: two-component system sensor histidine kinase CreC [Desulfobacterales bacterium CG07_land_8_20_14_0_80_52_14]|nr:MAG: two-component system sensor histidine kinase CreC [Desulfobacterales bacterium CG07_land_8_20_14_0_80_52_14]